MTKYLWTLLVILAAFSLLFGSCDNGSGTNGSTVSGGGGDAPIHHWLMNGNPNDSVGGKDFTIDGNYVGFVHNQEWDRQVMDFQGTNDPSEPYNLCWIENFNPPAMTELTTTIWLNPTDEAKSLTGYRGILTLERPTSTNGGQYILVFQHGYLFLGYGNASIDDDLTFNYGIGEWVHLALVYKGNTATLYVNGVKVGELFEDIYCYIWWNSAGGVTSSGNWEDIPIKPPSFNSFWIGGQQATQHFFGLISDVRLYNKALSASQIMGIINEAPQAVKDMMNKDDL